MLGEGRVRVPFTSRLEAAGQEMDADVGRGRGAGAGIGAGAGGGGVGQLQVVEEVVVEALVAQVAARRSRRRCRLSARSCSTDRTEHGQWRESRLWPYDVGASPTAGETLDVLRVREVVDDGP